MFKAGKFFNVPNWQKYFTNAQRPFQVVKVWSQSVDVGGRFLTVLRLAMNLQNMVFL
jgi:hypothetical protein